MTSKGPNYASLLWMRTVFDHSDARRRVVHAQPAPCGPSDLHVGVRAPEREREVRHCIGPHRMSGFLGRAERRGRAKGRTSGASEEGPERREYPSSIGGSAS